MLHNRSCIWRNIGKPWIELCLARNERSTIVENSRLASKCKYVPAKYGKTVTFKSGSRPHHHHQHQHQQQQQHHHGHHHHHHHHRQYLSARNDGFIVKGTSALNGWSKEYILLLPAKYQSINCPHPKTTSLRYSGDTSRGQEHKSNNNPYACSSQVVLSWLVAVGSRIELGFTMPDHGLVCSKYGKQQGNNTQSSNHSSEYNIYMSYLSRMGLLFIELHFGVANVRGKWCYMAMPPYKEGPWVHDLKMGGSRVFHVRNLYGQIWIVKIMSNPPWVFPDPLQGHSIKQNKTYSELGCESVCRFLLNEIPKRKFFMKYMK